MLKNKKALAISFVFINVILFSTEKFHDNIKSKYYIKPKSQGVEFTIRHYAGKVDYTGKNFLEKNKNFLPSEVIHLLRESSHSIIT